MDVITAEQAAEAAKGLTFEKVWAALMETRVRMEESQKQTQKQIEETQKQIDKTDKQIEKMSKELGGIGNTLGEFTESMFSPVLWRKFAKYGIAVTEQSERRTFHDSDKKLLAEVDVYIENGEYAIPVEVKTKLFKTDVNEHIKRIKTIRKYLDDKGDKRKLLGAVAGAVVSDKVCKYAQEKGLFVIVQSGDSAVLADMPEGFVAREW